MQQDIPRWVSLALVPVVQVGLAFLVAGLVIFATGQDPVEALRIIYNGAFGSARGLGYTLFYATSLVFVGLAVSVAFHAGLFNIGGEGQAYVGGLGIAIIALSFDGWMPAVLLIPLCIAGGAVFGAAWAAIPAALQAWRGSHIVITTIMFNFIAASLMQYLLAGPLQRTDSMNPSTRFLEKSSWIPKLQEAFGWIGIDMARSPANLSILLAVACSVGVYFLIWRTRWGYMIRTVGVNQSAAVYAGISPPRVIMMTMLISGGLAGLMGVNAIMGVEHKVELDFVAGLGFTGIAVALMGRNHPFGIFLAAILFGGLIQGGSELLFDMPDMSGEIVIFIQGLVVLFAGALEYMVRPFVERTYLRVARRPVTTEAEG